MKLDFHTLDVFSDRRFGGNPLAVVHGADALDTARMQTVAREFNLSETVFVMTPDNPAHTAKVRIFTPRGEIPFAGHPTVGVAALLAELQASTADGDREAIVVLEEQIGVVRVGVRFRNGQVPFVEFDAPKLPEDLALAPSAELLAAVLGLLPAEIGFENHRPAKLTAGLPYIFVPVRGLTAIGKATPDLGRWEAIAGATGAVYAYCRETQHSSSHFHARMFDPGHGIVEDPATGSAAAAFAGVVHRFDAPRDGAHKRVIEQGFEMGRPSLITLSLVVTQGKLSTVRIGGHAVRVTAGTIEV
jgi:trans-2,3-dihydro-3-hydroxyanthranilate isomerase